MYRYKITILLLFIISLITMNQVNGIVDELPLLGKLIYVDPGHGGIDPGAIAGGSYEEDITLEISKVLMTKLEEKGAIVYLTRDDDYDLSTPHAALRKRSDLSKRVELINESNCDMYLSVHLNASPSTTWKGSQVFYNDVNNKNKKLAEIIQKSFKRNLGSRRAIEEVKDLYMYKNIKVPGLLLEVGFITNANERYIMKKKYYQNRIALSIVEGVINYYK